MLHSLIKNQIKIATDFESPISHFEFLKKAALALVLQIAGTALGLLIAHLIIKFSNQGMVYRLLAGRPDSSDFILVIHAAIYILVVPIATYISSVPMLALCIRRAKQLEINTLFAAISCNIFGNVLILYLIVRKAINFIFYTNHSLQHAYRSVAPDHLKVLMIILIPVAVYFIYLLAHPDISEGVKNEDNEDKEI